MLCRVCRPLSICGLLVLVLLVGISLAAEPAAPPKEVTNSIGMKLVLIPSGKFMMGSPKDERDRYRDEDQHEVEITKPFYLGVYTVTVGQFRQFIKDTGYQTETEKDGKGGSGYNAENKDFVFEKRSTTGKMSAGNKQMTTRW